VPVQIACKTGAISIAYSFRIHEGISSGHADLPGFNTCKFFTIPCVVNSMLAMLGYVRPASPSGEVQRHSLAEFNKVQSLISVA